METKANYVAVGAFVLASFLGVIIATLWLAGAQYSQDFAHYETFFTGSVTGLGNGTPVRYNGIDVGRVMRLKFDPDNPKQVIVFMEVDPTLRLHNDSVATIASMGLTGGSYVEIDGGTKDAPMLTYTPGFEYPVIPSQPSTLQEIANSAPALIAKLNNIGTQLTAILNDDNRKALAAILVNTEKTTAASAKLTEALAAKSGQITATIDNLDASSGELKSALTTLQGTLNKANGTLGDLDKLTQDADNLVGGDTAQQIDSLLSETRSAVISMRNLANTLQSQPSSLIFGQRRKGYTPP